MDAAARNVITKITTVLPADLRRELDTATSLVGPGEPFEVRDQQLTHGKGKLQAFAAVGIVKTLFPTPLT